MRISKRIKKEYLVSKLNDNDYGSKSKEFQGERKKTGIYKGK